MKKDPSGTAPVCAAIVRQVSTDTTDTGRTWKFSIIMAKQYYPLPTIYQRYNHGTILLGAVRGIS